MDKELLLDLVTPACYYTHMFELILELPVPFPKVTIFLLKSSEAFGQARTLITRRWTGRPFRTDRSFDDTLQRRLLIFCHNYTFLTFCRITAIKTLLINSCLW